MEVQSYSKPGFSFCYTGPGRGNQGWDRDALRLHGTHGDDPPERGRDPELLPQIRTDHLRGVHGSWPGSHWLEVSHSVTNIIFIGVIGNDRLECSYTG